MPQTSRGTADFAHFQSGILFPWINHRVASGPKHRSRKFRKAEKRWTSRRTTPMKKHYINLTLQEPTCLRFYGASGTTQNSPDWPSWAKVPTTTAGRLDYISWMPKEKFLLIPSPSRKKCSNYRKKCSDHRKKCSNYRKLLDHFTHCGSGGNSTVPT